MPFEPGTLVRARAQRREGHTRLPAYLAGKTGKVLFDLGAFPFADERATGASSAPLSELYTVEFPAADVWRNPADKGSICADLFEEYLEPLA